MLNCNQTLKTYIEYYYIQPNIASIMRYEIASRNPLEVSYDDIAVAFRFCDFDGVDYINYSNWYFLGQEISLIDALKKFAFVSTYRTKLEQFRRNSVKKICITRLGNLVPMSANDITLENYQKETNKVKKL